MRSIIIGSLLCCVIVTAQKFYFDDIHIIVPTLEPKEDIIKFVTDLNSLEPKAQKKLCATFMREHLARNIAGNKTADCQRIVDQIADVKKTMDYIFDAVEKNAVVNQKIQDQIKNIFYSEDQKFNHDFIPVGFTFMKKSKDVVPADKWYALNSVMMAAAETFTEKNKAISDSVSRFHHPYDEEYYDKTYSD